MSRAGPTSLAITLCAAACVSVQGLSGGGGDAGAGEAGAPDSAAGDATNGADGSSDATPADASSSSTLLVHVEKTTAPTGNAQQRHLVYATHAARWWLFYVDGSSPTEIKARSSADLVTWTDAASLTLEASHANDGRNFSVAYADLGGHDVVHVAASMKVSTTDRRHAHARGVIDGVAITWSTPAELYKITDPEPGLDPDGPDTAATPAGTVFDSSGYAVRPDAGGTPGVANEFVWRSTAPDDGTTWAGFAPFATVDIVSAFINARALVPIGAGGALALWEKGDNEPRPTNVRTSVFVGGAWAAPQDLFSSAPAVDIDDWAVWRSGDTDVDAVRRSTAGDWEHKHFDGTAWSTGAAIAADDAVVGGGVVLFGAQGALTVVAIGASSTAPLRAARFTGGAWGAWSTLYDGGGTRAGLTCGQGAGKVALVWTEPAGTGLDLRGVLVTP